MRTTATTINAQSTPLTQNAFVIDAVGDLAKPVTITPKTGATGDVVRINVTRLGAEAADTYVGNLYFIGALFSYTSSL